MEQLKSHPAHTHTDILTQTHTRTHANISKNLLNFDVGIMCLSIINN